MKAPKTLKALVFIIGPQDYCYQPVALLPPRVTVLYRKCIEHLSHHCYIEDTNPNSRQSRILRRSLAIKYSETPLVEITFQTLLKNLKSSCQGTIISEKIDKAEGPNEKVDIFFDAIMKGNHLDSDGDRSCDAEVVWVAVERTGHYTSGIERVFGFPVFKVIERVADTQEWYDLSRICHDEKHPVAIVVTLETVCISIIRID